MKHFYLLKHGFLVCLIFFSIAAFGQGVRISGTVTDESNQPVPGASVVVKGTSLGTTTGIDGLYVLNGVPAGTQIIEVSFLGYQAAQKTINGSAKLDFQLQPSSTALEQVVVIGYGTAQRKEVTGAISTVSAKDFQKGSITTPEQLIAGKVAGVSITSNSGAPGSGSTIRIRGGASLNASNDPLIVIDGVPITNAGISGASNPLSLINPNDIASFTVLKDAASTAIYGSRASNGVIMITTKKGAPGKPVISFSTQGAVASLIEKADVLSPGEFRDYVNARPEASSLVNGVPFKSLMGNANTDWQDHIYKTAVSTDNNLSVSGTYKKIPFRISSGYLDQGGILKTDKLRRFTGGISLSPLLLQDHLRIDINVKGAHNNTRFGNGAAISSAVYFDPTQPVHAENIYGNYFEWSTRNEDGTETINKLSARNPVALIDLYRNTSKVNRAYGNVQFDYKFHFLPDLRANLNLGFDKAGGKGSVVVPAYAGQNFLDSGQNNQYKNKINNKVGEFYLNYNKTVASIKSNINATAGYGYYDNLTKNYNYPFVRANGNIVPGSEQEFPFGREQNTMISYFGRLIYTYNDRYILAASLRRDGSSKFSPDNRWGTFPSIAFTWRMKEESFLKDLSTLSDFKLRLSYGVTGQQDGIANYGYLSVYRPGLNASMVQFGETFYSMATPAAYDAGLKWEQTEAYNAGVDYGFLRDRITGSIDVYHKKTKNLLNEIPIPAGSNFASRILTNIGNIENTGVEFLINANPVRNKRLSWDLSFNATFNKTEITNLTAVNDPSFPGNPIAGAPQIHTVGYQPFAFYVYHQQYDQNGKPLEGMYADINEDGIINTNDLYRYKSPQPKVILGFTTQITRDKWSLSTVLRANIGNYMHNGVAAGAITSGMFNTLGFLQNSLSEINKSGFYYGQGTSDYFIQNASFLKMDNLSLSYNFGKVIPKASLSVNANLQNVFTVTKYTGIDPEIYNGVDNALYPRPRTFTLGANLQF